MGLMSAADGLVVPSSMLRFRDANQAWYWAVNGVLASAWSLALALVAGFSRVLACGLVAHAGAVILAGGRRRA